MNRIFLTLGFLMLYVTAAAQALKVSDADSKISFVIKNLGVNVDGTLQGLKGKINFDPTNPATSVFDVTVDVSTINTGNQRRDKHLKADDYFDAATYPVMRFTSGQVVSKGGNNYKAIGTLTIKNTSKKIGFDFTAIPSAKAYTFAGRFTIDRRDFGVGGNSMTMGDMVTVELMVVALK